MQSKLKDVNSFTKEISIDVPWTDLEENFIKHLKILKRVIASQDLERDAFQII